MKFGLTLLASILATSCFAQESIDYNSLPVTIGKKNNAPIRARLSDGKIHTLRLEPLPDDVAEVAKKIAAASTPIAPSATYTLTSAVPTNANLFYGKNQLPVLNQKSFGACVTFATSAALSYLTTGTTTSVSTLYVLDQGYIDAGGFPDSGWDGMSGKVLLQRLLPTYQGVPAQNQGYYSSYYSTIGEYDILSQEYERAGKPGSLTPEQLQKSGFDKQLNDYKKMASNTPPILFNKVTGLDINISEGSTQNANLVKQALDRGHFVLMGFNIFDANIPADSPSCVKSRILATGTAMYKFDASTGTLTQDTAATTTNAWVNASGCLVVGHRVWVVSYATDKVGNLMFIIRNSWGDTGDQGQYYMTQDYLNNGAYIGSEVFLTPDEKNQKNIINT